MEDKKDLTFPGAAEGMIFHVRGRKLNRRGQDKVDEILADTPSVSFGTREMVVHACQRRTTSGIVLSQGESDFYLAVLNQIAAGLRPSDVFKQFGLSYSEFRGVLDRDSRLMDIYKGAVNIGREARTIMLEDEAVHRAVEGDEEDVYYKGKVVGKKTVKSDSLMTQLLKAHDPDRYAERSVVEHGGTMLHLNITGVRDNNGDVFAKPPVDVTPAKEETEDAETETPAEVRHNPEVL